MLTAWADGIHGYQRSGRSWKTARERALADPEPAWFGSRLVLAGDWLWRAASATRMHGEQS